MKTGVVKILGYDEKLRDIGGIGGEHHVHLPLYKRVNNRGAFMAPNKS